MARKAKGRGKGCGTLERKGRVWRARWTVDGRTFTRSTGTSDKREAEKILAEIVAPFAAKSDAKRLENLAVKIEGCKAEIRRYEDSKPALALADGFEAYRRPQKTRLSRFPLPLRQLRLWTARTRQRAVFGVPRQCARHDTR